MSTATDGIVFWGAALPEDYEFNDRVTEIVHGDPDDETSELDGDGREWLAEHGLTDRVEFVHFCSETAPMWGVAAAGSVKTARRGWVEVLDLTDDPIPPWWTDVHKALKLLGVEEPPGDYGWRLVSYWEV